MNFRRARSFPNADRPVRSAGDDARPRRYCCLLLCLVLSARPLSPAPAAAAPVTPPTDAPETSRSTPTGTAGPGLFALLALDFFVPGGGALYRESWAAGATFAVTRPTTAYAAWYFWQARREYQSAADAARAAGLVFGPALRYKDPYGGGYGTAEDFQKKADRRAFLSGLSMTTHVVLTILSLVLTADYVADREDERTPVFPAPAAGPQPDVRLSVDTPTEGATYADQSGVSRRHAGDVGLRVDASVSWNF